MNAVKYKAMDIARWFIWKNQAAVETLGGEPITLLKLLKLLYYAEGCSLALNNESLFKEPIVAWEHGPVVVDVYDYYSKDPYNLPFDSGKDMRSVEKGQKNKSDAAMLSEVFTVFGQYSAWALRNKTRKEVPWIEATHGGKVLKQEISRETMKTYFKEHYIDE